MVCIILLGCSADHAMKKGDKYYALGEYFDAAAQYRKAYAQTPTKDAVSTTPSAPLPPIAMPCAMDNRTL